MIWVMYRQFEIAIGLNYELGMSGRWSFYCDPEEQTFFYALSRNSQQYGTERPRLNGGLPAWAVLCRATVRFTLYLSLLVCSGRVRDCPRGFLLSWAFYYFMHTFWRLACLLPGRII